MTDDPKPDTPPVSREGAEQLLAGSKAEAAASNANNQGKDNNPADVTEDSGDIDQTNTQDSTQDMGDVTSTTAASDPPVGDASRVHEAKALSKSVMLRFRAEGRWFGHLEQVRDDMMRVTKSHIKDKAERQLFVYSELDRLYPPILPDSDTDNPDTTKSSVNRSGQNAQSAHLDPLMRSDDSGQIQGLSNVPDHWPELPSNASLAAELAWVQANRLRVVAECPGMATIVCLDLALSPAPSWAALGWLETSIRSYAKYVDVAARATASDDGEAGVVRRERMAIDEVRGLLDEMRADDDGPCPRCGREG